jgi:hypothetical protein
MHKQPLLFLLIERPEGVNFTHSQDGCETEARDMTAKMAEKKCFLCHFPLYWRQKLQRKAPNRGFHGVQKKLLLARALR